MPKVNMPRADWDTVVMVLTMAQDHGIVAYIDNIIKDIDSQVAEQEY
jgi:hypothetical protein